MDKRKKGFLILLSIILIILSIMGIKNYRINNYLSKEYEPKYIINELYKSKEINYQMALDDNEKAIYDILIENFSKFKTNFGIDLEKYDYNYSSKYLQKVADIIGAVLMDHPELIQVGLVTLQIQNGSEMVIISPSYVISKEDYQDKINEIKIIIEQVKQETKNLNEFEKVKYVYDYIGKTNRYGNPDESMAQSAYSAFNSNLSPVCAGYARASQILFNNIGVKSLLVSGKAEYSLFLGTSHAWNLVSINSSFYLYDVTMSSDAYSTKSFYRGFLIDGNKHKPTFKKSYPHLNGFKYKEIYSK